MLLLKAKALPVGSKRKWKDGVYLKGSDHRWHKEKATELAHAQLKADNRHKDEELVSDFTEAVHSYADHLHEIDTHPAWANPDTDKEFWGEYFGEDDWDKNPSYLKLAKKVNGVVKKLHKHLLSEGKKEHLKEKKANKEYDRIEAKRKQQESSGAKKIEGRESIQFKNEIDAAAAAALISSRTNTHGYAARVLDGKEIKHSYQAREYIGFAVKVNGFKGVLTNFYTMKQRTAFGRRRQETGIPTLILLTKDGEVRVQNTGPVTILADPMKAKSAVEIVGSVKACGISEIVFDSDISDSSQKNWGKELKTAFIEFNKNLGVSLHGKVKIHIYGSQGPKRGATADYSSKEKVIRLSSAKSGSFAALAHELGHALDDKMNNWYGTGSYKIQDIVSAFRKTPQGMRESQRLSDERLVGELSFFSRKRRASRHTSWMNKPEEIFARCFETYVAKTCPGWKRGGWAKEVVDEESFKTIKPLFDKLLKDNKVRKAFQNLFSAMLGRENVELVS